MIANESRNAPLWVFWHGFASKKDTNHSQSFCEWVHIRAKRSLISNLISRHMVLEKLVYIINILHTFSIIRNSLTNSRSSAESGDHRVFPPHHVKRDAAGPLWLLVQQFPSFLFVCWSCFHVPARSMDSDQDVQETKATGEPHQSTAPIKSWWQRENRESPPCLMCVATGEREG